MDKTLTPVRRANKKRRARNHKAWALLSPDGENCRFCPHKSHDHRMSSAQPHFYRPATPEEHQDPRKKTRLHTLPNGDTVPVRRVVVSNQPELTTLFCLACAKDKDTGQVTCYSRSLANGEVVGLEVNSH